MTETQSLADRVLPALDAARLAHQALVARVAEITLAATVDATPEAVAERESINNQITGEPRPT